MIPLWIQTIMRLIRPELPKDFVGQVEVNVFKGGNRSDGRRDYYDGLGRQKT